MDGITFRTTDGTKWGAGAGTGTGGNLTPVQFDTNMWEFLTRIQAIENNPPVAVSILSFTVLGSQLQVNMTDGSHLGPYTLPIATFHAQGQWVNSMVLAELDLVTVPHSGLYLVNIAHTTPASPAVFDPNAVDTVSSSPTFGNPLYDLVFGEDVYIYDLGFFFPGKPGIGIEDGAAIAGHVFVHPVTIPIDLTESKASLRLAPAADLSFPIKHNGASVGSIDFAAGATVATFTFGGEVVVAIGDTLTVIKPATLDADARELAVTIKATRTF